MVDSRNMASLDLILAKVLAIKRSLCQCISLGRLRVVFSEQQTRHHTIRISSIFSLSMYAGNKCSTDLKKSLTHEGLVHFRKD